MSVPFNNKTGVEIWVVKAGLSIFAFNSILLFISLIVVAMSVPFNNKTGVEI